MFLSISACSLLYLVFNLALLISMNLLDCAPDVRCIVGLLVPDAFGGMCERRFTDSSSYDHCYTSCIIYAGRGGFVRFVRSKHACLAFSQLNLLGELVVATLDKGVFFGFLPKSASNGEIFVTPCGVFRKVFFILATSDASLYGVLDSFILIIPSLRFNVCIILTTTPMAL